MAGAGLRFSTATMRALAKRLGKLADTVEKSGHLPRIIGAVVESQTRLRLAHEKTDPEGNAWAPLSDRWASRKSRRSSGGILEYQGDLLDSITHRAMKTRVLVGSNLTYAAAHQHGYAPGGVPARPYLGLSESNRKDLMDEILGWVRRQFGDAR